LKKKTAGPVSGDGQEGHIPAWEKKALTALFSDYERTAE